jgi:hypothetical protein
MRVKWKLWLAFALLALVAAFFAFHYILSSTLSFDCAHRVLSGASSPDGQYIVTVSERSCGAVTHDYRIVSLRRRGSRFDGEDRKSWVFWMENNPEIKVYWPERRQLTILYPSAVGKRVGVGRWEDVAVASRESR